MFLKIFIGLVDVGYKPVHQPFFSVHNNACLIGGLRM